MTTSATETAPPRQTMNGKPVHLIAAKTVLNTKSAFSEKLLCDGLTFSMGSACVYSCSYCYVPSMMAKSPHLKSIEQAHADVVIRRENALEILEGQLLKSDGTPKYPLNGPRLVCFTSPLVDPCGNMDLVRETVEACRLILKHTPWDIRILSKSPLIQKVALALNHAENRRVIYGLSIGTLDDRQAAAYEGDTPRPSRRLNALHTLQALGYRTFGMICPSLPQQDYAAFAQEMSAALHVDKLEHVWAEVINVRGPSLTSTAKALHDAGYEWVAKQLRTVSSDKAEWEAQSRATFLAHSQHIPGNKLRYLQYVTPATRDWWHSCQPQGAVLLGKAAEA